MKYFLETDRLILRILSEEDAPLTARFYQDNWMYLAQWEPNVTAEVATLPYQQQLLRYETQEREAGRHLRYWYAKKDDPDHLCGSVCFQNIQYTPLCCCQIGYKQDQHQSGRGYATEAAEAAVRHLIQDGGFRQITAMVEPHNQSSLRLLARLGFHPDDVIPSYAYLRGAWQTCERWILTVNK